MRAVGTTPQVCTHPDVILSIPTIKKLIGDRCDGVIGQVRLCRRASGRTVERRALDAPPPRKLAQRLARRDEAARGGGPAQLTEDWGDELFGALRAAGGRAYSNYAVGYNNVSVPARSPLHALPPRLAQVRPAAWA